MTFEIQSKRAIQLVTALLGLRGPSCDESEVAAYVIEQLNEMGISEPHIHFDNAYKRTPQPGTIGNLIVKLKGTRKGPRRLLSAHMDTVPICQGCKPKIVKDTIRSADSSTGLGGDDRAGVAAILTGLREVLESGQPYPPLTLCFFVQEEIGLQGSRNLQVNKLGKPLFGLNFDGGNPCKLTIGATSGEKLKIVLTGVPAHAGLAPQQGASAINAAALAIASLHMGGWLGSVRKKFGTPSRMSLGTSNVGIIRGGNATNVVTELVEVHAEARSHDGGFRDRIASEIASAFQVAGKQVFNHEGTCVQVDVSRRVDYEAFRLDPNSEAVAAAASALKQAIGAEPQLSITDGGVDANWLYSHGIPSVTIGCGQREVHTNKEWLDIPDYLAACRIAKAYIIGEHEAGKG